MVCDKFLSVLKNHNLYVRTFKFWHYAVMRLFVVGIILPGWFLLGMCTAGYMWPPQFREYLFYAPQDGLERNIYGEDLNDNACGTTVNVSNVVLSLKTEIDGVKGNVKKLESKLDEILLLLRKQNETSNAA